MSTVFYSFHLFRPKFFRHLGFNRSEIGEIMAIMALVSFISMAFWGTVADRLKRHRLILAVSAIGMAGSFMLYLIKFSSRFYIWILFVGALYGFFQSGIQPLTDYQALKLLSHYSTENNPKDLYGRQRLWGTASYGLTSYAIGELLQHYTTDVLFYCLPASAIFFVIVLYLFAIPDRGKMHSHSNIEIIGKEEKEYQEKKHNHFENAEKIEIPIVSPIVPKLSPSSIGTANTAIITRTSQSETRVETGENGKKGFISLFSNPHYLFLLLVVFLIGSARAVMTTFLSLYLENDMKLSPSQIGIMANCGIAFEIVIFFFGPYFIRIIGVYWMLIVSQMAMVIRGWAYVFIPTNSNSVWYVYATELLKGVSFGFAQSAGVKLANDVSPPGMEATAQAVYTSMYSQLPLVITSFSGGRMSEYFGSHVLFLATAITSSAALVLFIVKYSLDGSVRIRLPYRH